MPNASFPRAARLLTAADYKVVFERPYRSSDAYFTVLATASRSRGAARLGLAVSKKQARRAVDRNRLKRLARETFRRLRSDLPAIDLVVMARSAALPAGNRALRASLQAHLQRLVQQAAGKHSQRS